MSNLPFRPTDNVTRRLPKLLVKGVEGPEELRHQIVERYAGVLKRFYSAAAHNHTLGIVDQTKSRIETSDYKLSYTNQGGRELVTIEVAAHVAGELKQELERVPDYAVVDLIVRESDLDVFFTAAMISPMVERGAIRATVQGTANVPINGIELCIGDLGSSPVDDYSNHVARPVIEWADYYQPDAEVPINYKIASLKVDFRDLPPQVMVAVDIYGYLQAGEQNVDTQVQWGWKIYQWATTPADFTPYTTLTKTAETGPVPIGTPNPYSGYVDNSAVPDLLGMPIVGGGYFPDNTYPPGAIEANIIDVPIPQGEGGYVSFYEPDWGYEMHENILHYKYERMYTTETVTQEVEEQRPCVMTYQFYDAGTQFFNAPPESYQHFTAMWVTQDGVLPLRLQFKEITLSSSSSSGAVTDDNPLGYARLGRLLLDRKHRAVAFQSA